VSTLPVAMPVVSDRVRDLHARMTLEEKLAQLVGFWIDHGGEVVAPMAGEMTSGAPTRLAEVTEHGIGHFTRVYGTRPVDPVARASWLWEEQRRLVTQTRLGIPALVHEECLTGLAAWQAATFPTPLAWGASFDPELVEEMAAAIGDSMRELGVHQGLAPVLDVIRDPRWGRVDECIGEDPYLVGAVGTAYVRGLQSAGVHATLKHFLGYSGSRAGRNHAPVSAGPRELADVYAVPFEMAVKDGGARGVMNSYNDVDGVPMGTSREHLTGLLREQWGFDGVVVADYFAVAFLALMHGVAADRGAAAALALEAGIDVELPSGDAYLAAAELVRGGALDEALVDRAVLRVLAQKEELGLLDADFSGRPPTGVDLDSPRHRTIARRLAEESVVLLSNDGVLPLAAPRRVAVIGPNADRHAAMMGCYSFANHVLALHPEVPLGIEVPSLYDALRAELSSAEVTQVAGCEVEGDDRSGFDAAVAAARAAEVAVVVVGDQAGLFGRGTVGEGNDAESLDLPGVQRELVEAVLATGTPVVMVLLTGRPYAVGWALEGERVPSAVLQAFFPGEEGGPAIARLLSGAAGPSGRLPVSLPRSAGAQPYSYLRPVLGGPSAVTVTDPTPARPFGFGLTYTSFVTGSVRADAEVPTAGVIGVSVTVTNVGAVAGTEVVQLYGRDVLASVVRPVEQLLGFARVELAPGESAEVSFSVPTARLAFSDRSLTRVVEPGTVELWVAESAGAKAATVVAEGIADTAADAGPVSSGPEHVRVELVGEVHVVGGDDPRLVTVTVRR
jgi:beta-glucosidase-like glycosyl hydrolase